MQKGFTLIELLAVILILGIIALIAVPTVNSIIKEARSGAFKETVQNIMSKASDECGVSILKGDSLAGIYSLNSLDMGNLNLEISGELPDKGIIKIDKDCNVNIVASNGTYTAKSSGDKINITDTKDDEELTLGYSKINVLGIGDSLGCGAEAYSIGDGGYNTLLQKYLTNINMLSDYKNVSVGGAVTGTWIDLINNRSTVIPYNGETVNPEYDYKTLLNSADIVTLAIGGNDGLSLTATDLNDINQINQEINNIKTRITELLNLIESNTDASIIYLGFYNPIIGSIYPEYALYEEFFNNATLEIDAYAKNECSKHNCYYISSRELFENKIDTYIPVKDNVHPTKEGYRLITQQFIKNLNKYMIKNIG